MIKFTELANVTRENPHPATWNYEVKKEGDIYVIGPIYTDFGQIIVKTNGPQGGDAGHGSWTTVEFETVDDEETYCKKYSYPSNTGRDDVTQIRVRGDWELSQIQKSFEVISNLLRSEFGGGWLP